jgi:hypothetical protein
LGDNEEKKREKNEKTRKNEIQKKNEISRKIKTRPRFKNEKSQHCIWKKDLSEFENFKLIKSRLKIDEILKL